MKDYIILEEQNYNKKFKRRCFIMVKLNKKQLENEINLAYALKRSKTEGYECFSALTLGLCEEWEHCGWCD